MNVYIFDLIRYTSIGVFKWYMVAHKDIDSAVDYMREQGIDIQHYNVSHVPQLKSLTMGIILTN